MGAQVTKVTFLTQPRFTLSFFKDGKSNEGDESHGWQSVLAPQKESVTLMAFWVYLRRFQRASNEDLALLTDPGSERILRIWNSLFVINLKLS